MTRVATKADQLVRDFVRVGLALLPAVLITLMCISFAAAYKDRLLKGTCVARAADHACITRDDYEAMQMQRAPRPPMR
jgi:hypothetical protein